MTYWQKALIWQKATFSSIPLGVVSNPLVTDPLGSKKDGTSSMLCESVIYITVKIVVPKEAGAFATKNLESCIRPNCCSSCLWTLQDCQNSGYSVPCRSGQVVHVCVAMVVWMDPVVSSNTIVATHIGLRVIFERICI